MVEAMVASVVGVVGILGVLGLLTNSMEKSREVSERFIATFLASEGVEIVRGLVDENYTNGTLIYTTWDNLFVDGQKSYYRMQYNVSLRDFTCGHRDLTDPASEASDGTLCSILSAGLVDRMKIVGATATTTPDPLLFHSADNSYGYAVSGGTVTPFTRVVAITYDKTVAPYKIKFDSTVFWNSQSGPRTITMEDYAYDWR